MELLSHIREKIPLYVVEIPLLDQVFVEYFTRIPWGEYRRIRHSLQYKSIPNEELEMQIFKEYIVPRDKYLLSEIEMLPAGVISVVAECIMTLSDSGTFPNEEGDIDVDGLTLRLNGQRYNVATNVELQIFTTICAVFHGYNFETLSDLPWDKILQLFACAERHLLNIGAIGEGMTFDRIGTEEENLETPEVKVEEKVIEPVQVAQGDEDLLMKMARQHAEMRKKEVVKEEPVIKEVPVVDRNQSLEPYLVKAAKVRENNPQRETLERLEAARVAAINKARVGGQSLRTDKVASLQSHADAGGVKTPVPGINHGSGFSQDDFSENIPEFTDEEALAEAESRELLPAGYEIIERRRAREQALRQEKEAKPIEGWEKKKHMTLRERKILKEKLKREGKL